MSDTPPSLPPSNDSLSDSVGGRMLLPVGRSGHAIAAGYLALFSILILPAPFALLFGILGIRDIRKHRTQPQKKHGMGRAIFGVIMGALGTIVLVVFVAGIVYAAMENS